MPRTARAKARWLGRFPPGSTPATALHSLLVSENATEVPNEVAVASSHSSQDRPPRVAAQRRRRVSALTR